jgi:hypothetical protein
MAQQELFSGIGSSASTQGVIRAFTRDRDRQFEGGLLMDFAASGARK